MRADHGDAGAAGAGMGQRQSLLRSADVVETYTRLRALPLRSHLRIVSISDLIIRSA